MIITSMAVECIKAELAVAVALVILPSWVCITLTCQGPGVGACMYFTDMTTYCDYNSIFAVGMRLELIFAQL